jgi:hypothetical protein
MNLFGYALASTAYGSKILNCLRISETDIPRYRGIFPDDNWEKICIHTRTGGGNRECYERMNDKLRQNPYFLFDEDDKDDETYANFWYSIPSDLVTMLQELRDELEN